MVLRWLRMKGMKQSEMKPLEQKPGSRPDAQMERIVKRPPMRKFSKKGKF